ncbi:hypothetical protein [Desulforamulus aquiferis]|uniref:Uncharacterized protein n=1 Tax=Desulforamulus aquiferis TaxID=1397668 RepID=A0AAW7Z8I0_9FIRM|nr:hypothetical protein [Desulforamulus aquiferis]MDO7786004.1 hypothetical protein [Desulforamulus aquiferis]RYD04708.1 hypothetical protein N752_12315 [Desulforamulus aquiferis]
MTQFVKNCPTCGQILVEKLVNVTVEEDIAVCYAESIPALVCVNANCDNREKYFAPFSYNLLRMKCPEIRRL